MANEEEGVGRETLDETRARAAKFLGAVGINVAIRLAMSGRGYTAAHHAKGWDLLHAASGYAPSAPAGPTVDGAVQAAITTIDSEDEDLFRVVRATLTHNFPAQAAVVLEGIGPSEGSVSVANTKILVGRIRKLAASDDPTDKAAAAELGNRSVGDAALTRLEGLIATAQTAADVVPVDDAAASAAEEKHVGALRALRAWYEEWSEIARSAVKRRDHLILLGLAKRRPPKRGPTGGK